MFVLSVLQMYLPAKQWFFLCELCHHSSPDWYSTGAAAILRALHVRLETHVGSLPGREGCGKKGTVCCAVLRGLSNTIKCF